MVGDCSGGVTFTSLRGICFPQEERGHLPRREKLGGERPQTFVPNAVCSEARCIRKLVLSFCKRLAHYEDKNTAKQCDRLYQKSFNTPHEENNNYDFFCVILELIIPSVPFNSHSSNCTFPLSWFVS